MNKTSIQKSFHLLCAGSLTTTLLILSVPLHAQNTPKKFYTIVDAQGNLITIPVLTNSNEENSPTHSIPDNNKAKIAPENNTTSARPKNNITQHTNYKTKATTQKPPLPFVSKPIPDATPIVQKTVKSASTGLTITSTKTQERKPETKLATTVKTSEKPVSTSKNTSISNKNSSSQNGIYVFDNSAYIDSTELERKAFNKNDEKRFFSVPNNFGGIDQVEKRAGVIRNIEKVNTKIDITNFQLADNYQVIPKKTLTSLLPTQCVPKPQLKAVSKLSTENAINLWVTNKNTTANETKVPKTTAYPLPIELLQLKKSVNYIQLVSYSTSSNQPKYYWPLPVFLDKKGCIISGVQGFYQQFIPSTWLKQSALTGNLVTPKHAAYLMFTPLSQSPNINYALTNIGSLQITAGNSGNFKVQ